MSNSPSFAVTVIACPELSACQLGCYGHAEADTRRFDHLAAEALVCDSYYVSPNAQPLSERLQQQAAVQFISLQRSSATDHSRASPVEVARRYDVELGKLLEQIPPEQILIVTSDRGDPGLREPAHAEWLASVSEPAVHVPLLIHWPEAVFPGRTTQFVTTDDLLQLIEQLANGSTISPEEWMESLTRSKVQYRSDAARVTRTRDWLFVKQLNPEIHEEPVQRLFRKPEDLWEVLDVSGQYPDVVDDFLVSLETPAQLSTSTAGSKEED